MPSRRSKNQNLKGCYTYHERLKDKEQMQYGNFERRISKDSIRDYDVCCLSLQATKEPVVSKDGILFDKESVLQYIIKQKAKNKNQKKLYEEYIKSLKDQEDRKKRIDKIKEINQFVKTANSVTLRSDPIDNPLRSVRGDSTPAVGSSFWVAGTVRDTHFATLTDGKGTLKRKLETEDGLLDGTGCGKLRKVVEKPDKHVRCPITNNPLEYKDLIHIRFKKIDGAANAKSKSTIAGQANRDAKARYCCAISGDPLTNATKLVIIKSPGKEFASVVSEGAYNTSVKPTGICPFTNKKLDKDAVLYLKRGGTGFSSSNDLQRTEKSAAFMAS